MYNEHENAKQALHAANLQQAQTVGLCGSNSYRPPTLREQAEKQVGYHREQADKHDRAAAFFRENPVFEQFVELLRSGAFQI